MSQKIRTVGVVGAGAMGRGIAQVCAAAGSNVLLFDMALNTAQSAKVAIQNDVYQLVAKQRLSQDDADQLLARIDPVDEISKLAQCDLVVEAIVEQLAPKQQLFRQLESIVSPACILATNTSSLSVTAIASACEQPQRVVGWHFFNPVPRMRLVEVVQAPKTSCAVVDALMSLSKQIGHRAVVTSDSPGFVVNHAGRAFVTEGLKMLNERTADHVTLDGILRQGAGFRMGPFELLDLTGLDVSVPVMESIHSQYYGDDRYRPVPLARTRMTAGLLGRKSKEGFYSYADSTAPTPTTESGTTAHEKVKVWWPTSGDVAVPDDIVGMLSSAHRCASPDQADVILLSPLGGDLSSTLGRVNVSASKTLAIDPLFSSKSAVTLMTSPATGAGAVLAAQQLFAADGVHTFFIADSPGYVAPRVVSCIINLACEMAQQGIGTPADIDAAVKLGLGYPMGPFEWGDRLGTKKILQILRGLHTIFGDQRYRPSPWLVRRAELGLSLSTPDRTK